MGTYRVMWHESGQNNGFFADITTDTIQAAAWAVATSNQGDQAPQLVDVQQLDPPQN
jgi:hypothetical protein